MKRMAFIALVVAIAVSFSGCASIMSQKASVREIQRERVYASGDADAIKMLETGHDPEMAVRAVKLDNGAGIGVDVGNIQALGKHPFRQVGAAILDVLVIWGGYEGIRAIDNSSSDGGSSRSQDSGRDSIDVNITGDGNDVQIGDSDSSTVSD